MKILVADDSAPIRKRLIDRLKAVSGVQVAEAEETAGALRLVQEFRPDIAVLDVRMPGGGGIKALSEIRDGYPGLTVIIMTNYPYSQYRRKCLEAGADFFFDKSSEFDQIVSTIQSLLESRPADIARRVVSEQLVAVAEKLEKAEQRQRDLVLLNIPAGECSPAAWQDAYGMWERTFDAIPDMVALFDADHRIVRVNRVMAERIGLPAAELIGKTCYHYMHGTCCPAAGCPHDAMLADGREHEQELYEPAFGCWLHVRVTPVMQDGRLIGAVHVARDITSIKKAEIDLRESEARFRQLFNSMHNGFALHEIICNEHGIPCDYRFLEVNPAFEMLTGLRAKQLIGRTVKEVLPGTESCWIETFGRVALGGRPEHITEFSAELGRWYSVSVYSPAKGQFAAVFVDVTAQKALEEAMIRSRKEAEEANRIKGRLLANMSHELRTPLNAIIGMAELLKMSELSAEQLDYINTICSSGESLLGIISDVLDYSRLETGSLQTVCEPFNLREMISVAVSRISGAAADKGLAVSTLVEDSLPEQINGDELRLRQVLGVLLDNAVKFTARGVIRLSVVRKECPDGSWQTVFSVEDSGIGMSPETVEGLFVPFRQGDSSITRSFGGTGLGLAICKPLVEQMGGSIRVESRERCGSVFTIEIPDCTAG